MTDSSIAAHSSTALDQMSPASTSAEPVEPINTATITPIRISQEATLLLHVRFRPDGEINEIAECPAGMSKSDWFKKLCAQFGSRYQARAGGRGFFSLSRTQLDALKASAH